MHATARSAAAAAAAAQRAAAQRAAAAGRAQPAAALLQRSAAAQATAALQQRAASTLQQPAAGLLQRAALQRLAAGLLQRAALFPASHLGLHLHAAPVQQAASFSSARSGDTEGMERLLQLAADGDAEGVRRVLQTVAGAGVDVNAANRRGWTALHMAARYGTAPPPPLPRSAKTQPLMRTRVGGHGHHRTSRRGRRTSRQRRHQDAPQCGRQDPAGPGAPCATQSRGLLAHPTPILLNGPPSHARSSNPSVAHASRSRVSLTLSTGQVLGPRSAGGAAGRLVSKLCARGRFVSDTDAATALKRQRHQLFRRQLAEPVRRQRRERHRRVALADPQPDVGTGHASAAGPMSARTPSGSTRLPRGPTSARSSCPAPRRSSSRTLPAAVKDGPTDRAHTHPDG